MKKSNKLFSNIFLIIGSVFLTISIIFLVVGFYTKIVPFQINGFIFGLVSLPLLIVGFVFSAKNSEKRKEKLKQNGTLVYARINDVIINYSIAINGRHPYQIICEYTSLEDGKIYMFKSEYIWFNPQIKIEENHIDKLPVYYDSHNIKKYYIDVSEITKDVVDLT